VDDGEKASFVLAFVTALGVLFAYVILLAPVRTLALMHVV
jgi:hypothetical protein